MRLENKVAVATGGARCLGQAVAALFLTSDEASYVTCHTLSVNGGMRL